MLSALIGLALKLGVPQKLAKPLIIGMLIALLVGGLVGGFKWLRSDAYHDGQRDERAAWEKRAAEMKAQAEQLQRRADQLRIAAETLDRSRIAKNRQEVDNALRNIPDQRTSPRQHARACLELRRQDQNPAACQPQSAGGSSHP